MKNPNNIKYILPFLYKKNRQGKGKFMKVNKLKIKLMDFLMSYIFSYIWFIVVERLWFYMIIWY